MSPNKTKKTNSVVAKQRKPPAGGRSPAERIEVMYNVEDPTLGLCREDYENRYKEIVGVCDECGDYIYDGEECYDEGDILCFKCFDERMKENSEEEARQ